MLDVLECCDRTAEAVALFQSASADAQGKPSADAGRSGSSGAGIVSRGRAITRNNKDEADASRSRELAAMRAKYREVCQAALSGRSYQVLDFHLSMRCVWLACFGMAAMLSPLFCNSDQCM